MSAEYRFFHDPTNQKTIVRGNHGKKYARAKAAVQMGLLAEQVDAISGGAMTGKVKRHKRNRSSGKDYLRATRRVEAEVTKPWWEV